MRMGPGQARYRKLASAPGRPARVVRRPPGPARRRQRSGRPGPRGLHRPGLLPGGRTSSRPCGASSTTRGFAERPLRGRGRAPQRRHRGRGCPALCRTRDRSRYSPSEPPRRHWGPGRRGPGRGRGGGLQDPQPALFHHDPAFRLRRAEHRVEPARPDRHPGGARARIPVFLHGQGRRSSNKIALFQESKALLDEKALEAFLAEKIRRSGVAACPPTGSPSGRRALAEMTLKTVKLARPASLTACRSGAGRRGAAFPRPGMGSEGHAAGPGIRSRGPVRGRGWPMMPASSACRATPGRARSAWACPATRPWPPRQDHGRGDLPRRGRAPSGPFPRRRPASGPPRRSPSISTGRWRDPGRPAGLPPAPCSGSPAPHRGPRHRSRPAGRILARRATFPAISGTTPSTMPAGQDTAGMARAASGDDGQRMTAISTRS